MRTEKQKKQKAAIRQSRFRARKQFELMALKLAIDSCKKCREMFKEIMKNEE